MHATTDLRKQPGLRRVLDAFKNTAAEMEAMELGIDWQPTALHQWFKKRCTNAPVRAGRTGHSLKHRAQIGAEVEHQASAR